MKNQQYRDEIEKLKFDLDLTCRDVDTLGKGLNKLEQYNLRENIEIYGIPDSVRNEELEGVVINILRRIGVNQLEEWGNCSVSQTKKKIVAKKVLM